MILRPAFTEEQIELLRSEAAGDVRNVAKQREIYFDVRTKIELENYLKTRKDKSRALFVTSCRKNKLILTVAQAVCQQEVPRQFL